LDVAQGKLKIEAHRGFKQEFLDFFREVSAADDSACGRVLRTGERIVIDDVETDTLYAPFHSIAQAAGYRAVQSTPIKNCEGVLLGTLATHFRSVYKPDSHDLRLLDLYVRQAADIIERHRAEDALRESEERLRLAQLQTGIGIWDCDLRTGKLTWTPELEALFGLRPGAVTCYSDFRDRVHPEDIAAIESARVAAVRRRETYRLEYRIIRPDGQIRWIAAIGGALYEEATGKPTRIIGNNSDISERKAAEIALAERNAQVALAEKAACVGHFAHDLDTGLITMSEGYVAIHGLPEGTTQSTMDEWRSRVHPDDLPHFDKLRRQTFDNRRPGYTFDYRIIRADCEIRWIDSRRIISYDGEGQPRRIVGINIDITERKELEDHKTTLVSELDHRVKNVLASVSAVAARTKETSRSMGEFVNALDGRIKSMANTHELLSSRHWQGIPLAELVRRELAPYATPSNTRLDGPDVVLSAEAGQVLAMVFHELATNAAKFGAISTSSGIVSVHWSFRRNRHAESWLCIQWQEKGGPAVVPPAHSGCGDSVVRELVPYELGGSVGLDYLPEGVRCRLQIPRRWLTASTRQESLPSRSKRSRTA
jgi:PAS domain S-box-containing protein